MRPIVRQLWPECGPSLPHLQHAVLSAAAVGNCMHLLFAGTAPGPSLNDVCGHGFRIQLRGLCADAVPGLRAKTCCGHCPGPKCNQSLCAGAVPGPRVNAFCGHGLCQQCRGFSRGARGSSTANVCCGYGFGPKRNLYIKHIRAASGHRVFVNFIFVLTTIHGLIVI